MKPPTWKPSALLAAVVTFGAAGLVLCANKSLGERWLRDVPYAVLVLAQWPVWIALWVLALALDRILDLVLDMVLPLWHRFGAKGQRK